MKKFTLSVIAAATTTAAIMTTPAIAQSYKGGIHTFPITIPALNNHFLFNVQGLYVQPSSVPFTKYNSIVFDNGVGETNYVKPEYQWAFKVGGGYAFYNTGNDIQLNWTYLKNTSDDSVTQTGQGINNTEILGPTTIIVNGAGFYSPDTGDTVTSSGKTIFKYNAIDLDLGQYVNFGSNLSTRWLIGARYAQISGTLYTTISGTEDSNARSFVEQDTIKAKFNGIGPRLGMSANYMVYNGAGVIAAASGFILSGNLKNTGQASTAVRTTSNGSLATQNSVLVNKFKTIVPGFDGKVGINYARSNISHNLNYLNVEAGYQVTQYSNAQDISLAGIALQHSDFGYNGPYLGMNLRFS